MAPTREEKDPPERPGAQAWVPDSRQLSALRNAVGDCRGCELWQDASQAVFSTGSRRASVLMVGEQPGDVEDREGEPFVGPAGRLLRSVIEEVGLTDQQVYLTNAVKHFRFRERGKRRIHQKPDLAHLVACRPWLDAEVAAVDPDLVVVLGATAARTVLGPAVRVTRQRGQLIEPGEGQGGPCFLPTVHPSSVLRARDDRSAARKAFVEDLRVAAAFVGTGQPTG